MDREKFFELLANPDYVRLNDLDYLESLIQQYPYFQAARLLAAKSIKNAALIKSAAAHSANRSVLMKVINGKFDTDSSLPNMGPLDIKNGGVNAFERLTQEDTFRTSDAQDSSFSFGEREPAPQPDSNPSAPDDLDAYKWMDFGENDPISTLISEEKSRSDEPWNSPSNDHTNTKEEAAPPTFEEKISSNDDSLIDDAFRRELMESLNNLQRTRDELMRQEPDFQTTEIPDPVFEEPDYLRTPEKTETAELAPIEEAKMVVETNEEPLMNENAPWTSQSLAGSNKSYFDLIDLELDKNEDQMLDPSLFDLNGYLEEEENSEEKKNDSPLEIEGGDTRQHNLIERFIKVRPLIQRNALHSMEAISPLGQNLYQKSIQEVPEIMTETIAKLMEKQGKPEKALYIYEQLCLANPDKSVYFASLIEKLKKEHTL